MRHLLTWASCLALLCVSLTAFGSSSAVDENVVGTWTWKWRGADGIERAHVMEVRGDAGSYVARERMEDLEPVEVSDLKVIDGKISFAVSRGEVRATYTGKIASEDTINGVVRVQDVNGSIQEYGWTARRVMPEPDEPIAPRSEPPESPEPRPAPGRGGVEPPAPNGLTTQASG